MQTERAWGCLPPAEAYPEPLLPACTRWMKVPLACVCLFAPILLPPQGHPSHNAPPVSTAQPRCGVRWGLGDTAVLPGHHLQQRRVQPSRLPPAQSPSSSPLPSATSQVPPGTGQLPLPHLAQHPTSRPRVGSAASSPASEDEDSPQHRSTGARRAVPAPSTTCHPPQALASVSHHPVSS